MGQLRLLGEPPAGDDHAALANLAFPQAGHTGFVAAAGLGGGQTVIGGTAAGESLSLQSTAHATRGIIEVIDNLRLASGLIQDSGGNARIALATASPHLTLTGDLRATKSLALRNSPYNDNYWLNLSPASPGQSSIIGVNVQPATVGNVSLLTGFHFQPAGATMTAGGAAYGVFGAATVGIASGATIACIHGLDFTAFASGGGGGTVIPEMHALHILTGTTSYTGTVTAMRGLYVRQPFIFGGSPVFTTSVGVDIANVGPSATIATAIGLRIADINNAAIRYLVEAGPGTPYLRLVGGGPPGAGLTNLYLNEGGTLRRVQSKDFSTLVAGDRVVVLV